VHEADPLVLREPETHSVSNALSRLQSHVEEAAKLLPTQGPISVFVYFNPLQHFEQTLSFCDAVEQGEQILGCRGFLSEEEYRRHVERGRIRPADLAAVLSDELGDEADRLIGFMGTRFHLRLAMLEHPFQLGSDASLRWLIDESDVLHKFRPEVAPAIKSRMLAETRRWLTNTTSNTNTNTAGRGAADAAPKSGAIDHRLQGILAGLDQQFPTKKLARLKPGAWESFTLHLLWRICRQGVHAMEGVERERTRTASPTGHPAGKPNERPSPLRLRHPLFAATGKDIDRQVDEMLIRFTAAFLDQGFAPWPLPHRDSGYLNAFIQLYQNSRPTDAWLKHLPRELRRIATARQTPLQSIRESLDLLGISAEDEAEFIAQTLLPLRGWAGMLWQMETNAEWTVRPAPRDSLTGFLAVRLLLERLALETVSLEFFGREIPLDQLADAARQQAPTSSRDGFERRAYLIFQLAQLLGWTPAELHRMTKQEWGRLVEEIEGFSSFQRRKTYHLAYERNYHRQMLDAAAAQTRRFREREKLRSDELAGGPTPRPSFQIVTCIDDREESFRRHLEEIDPTCETFSAPGFYAVAMYYKGASDAHFRPLCPAVVKPEHYVREEPAYSLMSSSRQRAEARRLIGSASHRWHLGSRTFLGGAATALLGSLASIPMVTRIILPRFTSQIRRLAETFMQPPSVTELRVLRTQDPPGPVDEHLGYTLEEMAGCVSRVLLDTGLPKGMARLILILGHGSSSQNNPHESAYHCGACNCGRGGPNARAFSQMANDPRVRALLSERGVKIPDETWFVGGYHNTCDDDVVYFDLDRLPISHRREFERAREKLDQTRERNAHERCRRFESAPLTLSPAEALAHVETRAEDMSQARPEYDHATNAVTIVGRRSWTRGLYLDRRAFLNSYDPAQDDATHSILARILAPAVPVCAGISLLYYFSAVDIHGYGAGSKLPHNITSLLGVMEGAASDLRAGLSQQMIEIHEPMRNLFLIETTPAAMHSIMAGNEMIRSLIENEWIRTATIDVETSEIHFYEQGAFRKYTPENLGLPVVASSADWYRGHRQNLGFASIDATAPSGDPRPFVGAYASNQASYPPARGAPSHGTSK